MIKGLIFGINVPIALIVFPITYTFFCLKKNKIFFWDGKSDEKKIDLRGQICIITGSNTGIGKRAAANIAKLGALCILACRDEAKGEQAAFDINQELRTCCIDEFPNARSGRAEFSQLDLSSLESVYEFAQRFKKNHGYLDILVNNAGLGVDGLSSDGYGQIYQVNYLGHFLLSTLLLPQLSQSDSGRKSLSGRVVNLSSVTHRIGEIGCFETIGNYIQNKFITGNFISYPDTKLYMLLLSMELNRRCTNTRFPVYAISVNPGAVRSDIWRFLWQPFYSVFDLLMRVFFLTVDQGSMTTVMAASMPITDIPMNLIKTSTESPSVPYLVPYPILPVLTVASEMIGPYVGPKWAAPSLPADASAVAKDLWRHSSELCKSILRAHGLPDSGVVE